MTVTDAGLDGSDPIAVDERDDLIARRIREWQKRLLQLDRRNNLLYFKPGRSAVGITEIGPDELDRWLQTSRSGLTFTYAERRQARKGGVEQVPGSGDVDEPGPAEGPRIIAGELHTDCEPLDLQRRLRNLWRRDREWHAEQGLNILFLAAGFLNWVDAGGEPARAPLLLIPCDLVRKSPRDPFRLVREDDDAVVNPTLRHQLAELGIELPELDNESGDGEAMLEAYIASVGLLTAQRPDWSVDSALVLGAFSFSKLAMYEDLSRMLEHGVQNPLTRQLAGDAGDEEHDSGTPSAAPSAEELAGGRLDELLDVRDQHAILPADFSQLRAVQQARMGANLVIHGPPGTGKSQTIANLIATLLADGKRVLFVSEKMAALDVVKRRLEECGLGAFCLDLHSDRGRKREVYNQLGASLADERERIAASVPLDELIESRDRLNSTVRRLHQRREPLGLSVYEVQGRFASLREQPRCEDIEVPSAAELDQEWLREANRRAEAIPPRTAEFRVHNTSRWLTLRTPQPSLQLAYLIRGDMALVQPSVADLRAAADPHVVWLGLPAVESAADAAKAIEVLELLERAPAVPAPWLEREAVARLRQSAHAQAEHQRRRRQLEEELRAWFGGELLSIDYRAAAKAVELSADEQKALAKAVGRGWRLVLGADPDKLSRAGDVTAQALDELLDSANTTAQLVGQEPPQTLASVAELSTQAKRILALDPVPERWLDRREADVLKRDAEGAQSLLTELAQAEERLRERYSDALADLVDEDMLIRYRTDHQSLWRRRIGGAFRRDQRILRGQLKVPGKLSITDALAGVEQALEVQRLRLRWLAVSENLAAGLGSRFDDRETDWERVWADMAEAGSLARGWHGDSTALWELLAAEAGGAQRRDLERSQPQLEDAASRFLAAAAELGDALVAAAEHQLQSAAEVLQAALDPLRRVAQGSAGLYQRFARPIGHYHQLTELIEHGAQLMLLTEEAEARAPQLAADFGPFFEGDATQWNTVGRALDWSEQLLEQLDGRLSETLRNHAIDPQPPVAYAERQQDVAEGLRDFRQFLSRLDQRLDGAATSWRSWEQAPFAELVAWSSDLAANAGEAASWVEYREAVDALDEHLGAGATSAIRARTEEAADVPKIVRSRIYESWLEQIYASEPELREFSRVNHEQIRSRFRALDQALPLAARQRVRERVFADYPPKDATPHRAGQLAVLRQQLSRRNRRMSVRRLMERIPNLLLKLKPCFLMSPLAASQYLPGGQPGGERIEFDALIFDEASQVWPEEALPAIERSRQVIVAGDRQQLPPSRFFRSTGSNNEGAESDDEDEGPEDAFAGRESILDAMVGQLGRNVGESWLGVHYRSRCESLIRFSNHAFYENRLLTFPGPNPDEVCVRSVYLNDATYDRGGSRTNRVEAERVTEIVFDLMQTTPSSESLGVVALSRPQADLIELLIEERRLLERHLDERFSEDRVEHFFVKNLENVQGDERDHMILSVGFGPTPAGAVPNNFGPINQERGERRLNVAVTRARQSMTVVHSIRPDQIRSQGAGARMLRRYLEFAANPAVAFEAELTGTGEPESPFEEAVLAALRNRGHQVESQIGVSGYRIDLGIGSEDGDGFDLGIECDGATYHGSPAARDRDWLRQQVLERLGWRIHRVWSTSWIRNPQGELAAIEQALKRARTEPTEREHVVEQSAPTPLAIGVEKDRLDAPHIGIADTSVVQDASSQFEDYERFSYSGPVLDPFPLPLSDLALLVEQIVEVEQPVHVETVFERLKTALDIPRLSSNVRMRLTSAIRRSVDGGSVVRDTARFLTLTQPGLDVRPRCDGSRNIDRVADAELDAGLLAVARATFGAERADLVRMTARQFGYGHKGTNIAARLEQRVDSLLEVGRLSEQSGTLVESVFDDLKDPRT